MVRLQLTLTEKGTKFKVTKRWLKKEHCDEIKDKLAAINWQPMNNLNVDEAIEYLNNQVITIMDEICPITKQSEINQ